MIGYKMTKTQIKKTTNKNLKKVSTGNVKKLTKEEIFNILLEDYNYIGSTISLSQEQLRLNIKRYINVGIDLHKNVSLLGDKLKREALVKRGIKVLKFKPNADKPNAEPQAKDYHFTKGFSNDIISCLNNLGKFAECKTVLFECKNGEQFVEKFFLRNGYESIKNGNTNLNKTYEIKDNEIVKKEKAKKDNKKASSSSSSSNEDTVSQDEENPKTNLEIRVNEIISNDYFKNEIKDVRSLVASLGSAILKDLGITENQFKLYRNSNVSKTDLKIVNQK